MDATRLVRYSRVFVAAATVVGAAVWCWLGAADDDAPPGLAATALATPFVLAIVHAVLFRRLWWRSRHAPAEFLIGLHGGAAAFRPARAQSPYGAALIVAASIVGGRIGALRHHSDVVDYVFVVALVLITVRVAASVFRESPPALTADGVAHGSDLTRWDDLWPADPVVSGPRAWALQLPVRPSESHPVGEVRGVSSATWDRLRRRGLETNVNAILAEDPSLLRPEDPAAGPAWVTVDLRGVAIDRAFLVDAIRYYRETPSARPAIGTADARGGHGVEAP